MRVPQHAWSAVLLCIGCGDGSPGLTVLEGVLEGRGSESLAGVRVTALDRQGTVIDETRTDAGAAFALDVWTNDYTAIIVESSLPTGFVVYGLAGSHLEETYWIRDESAFASEFGSRLTDCPVQRPSVHVFDGLVHTPITFPTDLEDRTHRESTWIRELVDQPNAEICTQTGQASHADGETGAVGVVSSSANGVDSGFVEYVLETETGLEQPFLAYVPPDGIAAVEWAWFMEAR